ncbi:MAG: hypothetical protein Aurels2KO_26690 [Aureliella sp.]
MLVYDQSQGAELAEQTYFSVRNSVASSPASIWEKCMKFETWINYPGNSGRPSTDLLVLNERRGFDNARPPRYNWTPLAVTLATDSH